MDQDKVKNISTTLQLQAADMNMDSDNNMLWKEAVPPEKAGTRLDAFWGEALKSGDVSRQKVKSWITSGLAKVNGKVCQKANTKVAAGDILELAGEVNSIRVEPEDGELDVIYEDEHILVVNKPAGLTTHPAPSCMENTLVQRLIHHYPHLKDMDPWRPGIIHRLDKETSGLMVVALTEAARLKLARDFEAREVHKLYLALAYGCPERTQGMIEKNIGRDPSYKTRMAVSASGGKQAKSEYQVLWSCPEKDISLVGVRIFTGRTHQVRVHMADLGHPLMGDSTYGSGAIAAHRQRFPELAGVAKRVMLHAASLSFIHPETGKRMEFSLEPPKDFFDVIRQAAQAPLKIGLVGMPAGGKSLFCRMLAERGVPVFSADACVAEKYEAGGDGAYLIASRFGERFIDPGTGAVDKKALFQGMRESEGLRREVMDLVHPLVWAGLEEFWKENAGVPFAVAEIPLLLESGDKSMLDYVVGIHCPDELRYGRFVQDRGIGKEYLALMDSWQFSQMDKLRACDLVVQNTGEKDQLRSAAVSLITIVEEMAENRTRQRVEKIRSDIAAFSRSLRN